MSFPYSAIFASTLKHLPRRQPPVGALVERRAIARGLVVGDDVEVLAQIGGGDFAQDDGRHVGGAVIHDDKPVIALGESQNLGHTVQGVVELVPDRNYNDATHFLNYATACICEISR